jgi:hypothetical protein
VTVASRVGGVVFDATSPSAATSRVVHSVTRIAAPLSVCTVGWPAYAAVDPEQVTCMKCLDRLTRPSTSH